VSGVVLVPSFAEPAVGLIHDPDTFLQSALWFPAGRRCFSSADLCGVTAVEDESGVGKRWRRSRPSKTTLFWSCMACAGATMIVGFTWGGWVTGGTAAKMATTAADGARAQIAAVECVDRFEKAPDVSTQLVALKKTDAWNRDDFIRKGGWVTLPGMKEPVSGAADICVQQLMNAKLPAVNTAAMPK
jgi:hypothetical protein